MKNVKAVVTWQKEMDMIRWIDWRPIANKFDETYNMFGDTELVSVGLPFLGNVELALIALATETVRAHNQKEAYWIGFFCRPNTFTIHADMHTSMPGLVMLGKTPYVGYTARQCLSARIQDVLYGIAEKAQPPEMYAYPFYDGEVVEVYARLEHQSHGVTQYCDAEKAMSEYVKIANSLEPAVLPGNRSTVGHIYKDGVYWNIPSVGYHHVCVVQS